jgi:exodeoxyribonuclease VII large subunit
MSLSSPTQGSAGTEPARRVFSVSKVVRRADEVLREATSLPFWVRGEISGWQRAASGHCYFCLKDDQAELQCVLWRERASQLPALPRDGMEVEVLGGLGIFVKRGRFQLDVQRLDLTGSAGLWNLAKEELIRKLRAEGLLDDARKRPLPAFPERIGLVTSGQGAALQDLWRTMRRRAWWTRVFVSGCAVEGVEAAPDIVRALRRFGPGRGQTPVDVVIVARGGGSRESLWAFNTEPVARAIAECPYPVVSAVGHETDYTVADFTADLRAATPTAGAEHVTPDGAELLARFRAYPDQLRLRVERSVAGVEEGLDAQADLTRRAVLRRAQLLITRLEGAERTAHARAPRERQRRYQERLGTLEREIPRRVRQRVEALSRRLEDGAEDARRAVALRLDRLGHRLARHAAEADARSPLRALARGYAMVTEAEGGAIVRSPDQAPAGTPLAIRLAGGALRAVSTGPDPDPELPELLTDA